MEIKCICLLNDFNYLLCFVVGFRQFSISWHCVACRMFFAEFRTSQFKPVTFVKNVENFKDKGTKFILFYRSSM